MAIENLDEMLQKAFDESTKIYQERGFQRRIGFGKKPAIVSVDLANAWTRPGNPFTCDMTKMDNEIIPGMQRLLEAARANGHVVVHVTTAYQNTNRDDPHTDMGQWHNKIPVEAVSLKDEDLWAIDSRIAPIEGEWVMLKKRASAFSGTPLAGYLRTCGVDTILVTGVTATACVRTTICDGIQDGFRTIAVRECIGDRVPGAVAWNLYDIDAKFADVESVDTCVNYLNNVEGWNNTATQVARVIQDERMLRRAVERGKPVRAWVLDQNAIPQRALTDETGQARREQIRDEYRYKFGGIPSMLIDMPGWAVVAAYALTAKPIGTGNPIWWADISRLQAPHEGDRNTL